jgi:XTP/dITP diphosphohydrolase
LKLFLASTNEHKLRELRAALPVWEIALLDAPGEPVEDGETFLDNARIKVRHGRAYAPADAWVAGEDSGIEVVALGGRPGVESARWAADGVAHLLSGSATRLSAGPVRVRARGVDARRRGLRATGMLEGDIADAPRGSAGFGYDPIFVPLGSSSTVAELGDAWKAEHSHRARAASTSCPLTPRASTVP